MLTGVITLNPPRSGFTDQSFDWKADPEFLQQLTDELRRLALRRVTNHASGISASSLVQETLLRLLKSQNLNSNACQIYLHAAASRALRFVLVDHVRRSTAEKRLHSRAAVGVEEIVGGMKEDSLDILAVDEALTALAAESPLLAEIVEMRFFGDLPIRRIAELMGRKSSTVHDQWNEAREWLFRFMSVDDR